MSKLYVGNLAGSTTDESLQKTFADYGQVLDSIVMRDRDSGNSRGFGFVTYASPMEASAAIGALNNHDLDGNQITVNMANARPAGGSGGGGYSGGYGGDHGAYGGGYQQGGGYGNGGYPQGVYGGGY
ncbi:heterogeneous nuclear ribonucleoprotein G [Fusarium pseudoanthophilum]|uniref:Heterogeneous nuclear ribonucleoprotein G n=1 Tax=Fusarium pseudoanthophilum TaxID=48495 RepID=A0A8H5PSU5_9HYPO|nr:heterogeneous nuclear ribonucleoprotein G [Fusarium pseudoanthophilum]